MLQNKPSWFVCFIHCYDIHSFQSYTLHIPCPADIIHSQPLWKTLSRPRVICSLSVCYVSLQVWWKRAAFHRQWGQVNDPGLASPCLPLAHGDFFFFLAFLLSSLLLLILTFICIYNVSLPLITLYFLFSIAHTLPWKLQNSELRGSGGCSVWVMWKQLPHI